LLSLGVILLSIGLHAQSIVHKGVVLDELLQDPIACMAIKIHDVHNEMVKDTLIFTDFNGEFTYLSVDSHPYLDVELSREGFYHEDLNNHYLEYDSIWVLKATAYDSYYGIDDSNSVTTFYMDLNAMRLSYVPFMENYNSKYSSYFVFSTYIVEPIYDFYSDLSQIGMRISYLDFSWLRFSDTYSLTNLPNEKERYFSFGASFYLFHRFTFTKHNRSKGLFLDMGAGYHIPYYYSYVIKQEKSLKTVNRDIYKYNDLRAYARLGYSSFAVYATYRFFDVMQVGYAEPPQWEVGLEFPISIPFE
jgi:hypothetical protein